MTKVLRRKITCFVPLSVYRSVCKYSECISQVCTLETSATGRWIQSGTYIMYQKVLWYAFLTKPHCWALPCLVSWYSYSMSFTLRSVVCTWLYLLSVQWVQYGEVAAVGQREDDDFPRVVESRSSSDVQLTVLSRDDWWHHVPYKQVSILYIIHTVNMINIAYWLGKNTRFKKAWIQIFSD